MHYAIIMSLKPLHNNLLNLVMQLDNLMIIQQPIIAANKNSYVAIPT